MKYAIFDLDGTLTDSMGMWRGVANEYLVQNGFPAQEDITQLNNATWVEEFLAIAKERFNFLIKPETFFAWISNYALEQYTSNIKLKPTAIEFLDKLKADGVKMCICSSTYKFMMLPALKRLDLTKYFEFTCHCREYGKEKNQPDIFLHCMQQLGAKNPCEVVVFEDALYAASTAKKAGFYVVGIFDSTECRPEALKSTVNQYITDYTQVDFSLLPKG